MALVPGVRLAHHVAVIFAGVPQQDAVDEIGAGWLRFAWHSLMKKDQIGWAVHWNATPDDNLSQFFWGFLKKASVPALDQVFDPRFMQLAAASWLLVG